jgi:UbiD family decarboxylase
MNKDQSIRGLISQLEQKGELHHVQNEVDPQYELAAVLSLRARGPAQFFRQVKGYQIPVVGNLINSRARIARSLGLNPGQLDTACLEALDRGIPPEIVKQGPVQEVIHNEPLALERLLPVPTWYELEEGPYVTAGVIVAKDPTTGLRNVSIARLRVEGGNRMMAGIGPTHHLSELLRRAEALGQPLEMAVAIGNHPAMLLASQMYVDLGHDEFDIAGRLLREPVRLVPCRTVDLEVPAEAEIVLEGTLHADEPIQESHISEFQGFYLSYGPGQSFKVNAVTHRKDPIYQAISLGFAPEHALLGGIAIGATTCRALQRVIPSVRRVVITEGGMGRLHAIITMENPKPGEEKRAIVLAMGQTNLFKLVLVVDHGIDPEDPLQVEWAVAAHFRGEEDLLILPGMKADRCELHHRNLTVTKMGLVATGRYDDENLPRKLILARIPSQVLEKVRQELESY